MFLNAAILLFLFLFILLYIVFSFFVYNLESTLQKPESGGTTLISSDGDTSSGTKSFTTPSTHQVERVHFPAEPRYSNSLITENIPADNILHMVHDRELPTDDLSLQEMPLVCILSFVDITSHLTTKLTSCKNYAIHLNLGKS